MRVNRSLLLAIPALLLFLGFVLGPLFLLIRVSLYRNGGGHAYFTPGTVTWENYLQLADPYTVWIILYTVGFGVMEAVMVILLAYPLAMFIRLLDPRQRPVALMLVLLPKTAGLLATCFGLQRLLPRGMMSALLCEAYLILPYAVLLMTLQLQSIDSNYELAARGLGATHWQTFRRVTFPMSLPGLFVSFEIALMWGLGAFLGPLFLGGPPEMTLSVEIHRQAFEYGRWPKAAAESAILLGLTGIAMWIVRKARIHTGVAD